MNENMNKGIVRDEIIPENDVSPKKKVNHFSSVIGCEYPPPRYNPHYEADEEKAAYSSGWEKVIR